MTTAVTTSDANKIAGELEIALRDAFIERANPLVERGMLNVEPGESFTIRVADYFRIGNNDRARPSKVVLSLVTRAYQEAGWEVSDPYFVMGEGAYDMEFVRPPRTSISETDIKALTFKD